MLSAPPARSPPLRAALDPDVEPPMSRFARAELALHGLPLLGLALLGLALAAEPAAAQLGSIFGDPPPRPPSAVPTRQPPLPPPGSLQPVTPLRTDDPLAPEAASPPAARGRPLPGQGGGLGGFESQPLAPPPGSAAAPPAAPGRPGQPPAQGAAPGQPAPGPAPALPEEVVTEVPTQKVPNPTAVFSGLDKITGRITKFEVALNETVQYGALQVRPRACYTRPPTEAPNTTGFVEVDEVTLQGEVKKLFRGWMFAASPGLHGVEHSIYDVWLSDCKGAATVAEVPPAPPPPAAAPPARQRQPAAAPAQQRQPRPPPAQPRIQ
jgi:hypothetical protein